MLDILRNMTYRRLLAAQVVALLGTGLATVALALLAFDLAGAGAGAVLGTALFIKMVAYVGISPFAGALAPVLPRKTVLIGMDLVRAGVAVLLPFVDQVWQVYVLIFVLQSASAIFTPTFQATIPDVLTEERDYTRALSLSRLAYDLENLLSPAVAAILLLVVGFHVLFAGTAVGFLLSALLVLSATLPAADRSGRAKPFSDRVTRGLRIFLATPRLRGLLALNLSAAAAGAMVIVNTVVIVRSLLGRSESELGLAMASFGAGSMLAALALPRLLDRVSDRPVMLAGAAGLGVLTAVFAGLLGTVGDARLWLWLLGVWFLLGMAYSSVLTPTGRLLRRSAHAQDRPSVFAAQFALSHACWLVTYPLAGWLGAGAGMAAAMLVLSLLTFAGAIAALVLWPAGDALVIAHRHEDLPGDHPHLREGASSAGVHRHPFVIDDLHPSWPRNGL
jgi:MFS family permease